MLMPALVEPTFTEAQMFPVRERASGMERIRAISPGEKPFCTRAEYPPMKFTPRVSAARWRVRASFTGSPPLGPAIMATGVTAMRLLMMGMPYCRWISSPVLTRSFARRQTLS